MVDYDNADGYVELIAEEPVARAGHVAGAHPRPAGYGLWTAPQAVGIGSYNISYWALGAHQTLYSSHYWRSILGSFTKLYTKIL